MARGDAEGWEWQSAKASREMRLRHDESAIADAASALAAKENDLMPIFTLYNVKCSEVEDYIKKYKPIYDNYIINSIEYGNL